MSNFDDRKSGPDEIWVCQACGRTKEGDRYALNDISCMLHAVLCKKEKVDGKWVAVSDPPEHAGA